MKNKRLHIFWLIVFLCGLRTGFGQEYNTLGPEAQTRLKLRSHVLVDLNELNLADLQTVMEGKTPLAVFLSENDAVNTAFFDTYGTYSDSLVVLEDKVVELPVSKEITVLQIPERYVEIYHLNGFSGDSEDDFGSTGALHLVQFDEAELALEHKCMAIWNRFGTLPNFIKTTGNTLGQVDSLVRQINTMEKVFGQVRTQEGPLHGVAFKDFRKSRVNGFFSFPILEEEPTLPVLVPHKAGYRFSPDIIFTAVENQHNPKDFVAFRLDTDFGLTDEFVFRESVVNTVRKNDKEIISNGVEINEDPLFGTVGFFGDRAYVDAGLGSRVALQSEFTISAWVKPTTLDLNNSILGKGDNFVLKLHEGFLTFTMAGIKDYISEASPIPLNQWTHVALVHAKLDNELLFYVNGERTDRVKLISEYVPSTYHILVGSNLWEEFFAGYLGQIKIWERELNAEEIRYQYEHPHKESKGFPYTFSLIAIVLVSLLALTIFIWRKKSKKKETASLYKPIPTPKIQNKTVEYQGRAEQLRCFGTLRVYDASGRDLAKKLSPKLKEIFTLILLYSQEQGKGISTNHLTELLWPGLTSQGAKNTRGTSIQNLRTVLASSSEIELAFVNKHWYMQIGDGCYFDYGECQNYLDLFLRENYEVSLLEKELPKVLSILQEGRLLASSSRSWLDPFIEKFSNRIIEQCLRCSVELNMEKHADLLFRIAEVIYLYDELNEKALRLKLQVLVKQGKLSLAHTVHDNFAKLYRKLYDEDYGVSFQQIVSG
ncbi:LamG-like jellyroll fold domain-containing protein [Spongiimicrobium sp. 2-473A-2-J]|uniref:LamG-like jellyroll fold domain-containing protein n=1 Tax=Eudoraea algarum TaxID=3417568 RepID=UPI003D36D6C2